MFAFLIELSIKEQIFNEAFAETDFLFAIVGEFRLTRAAAHALEPFNLLKKQFAGWGHKLATSYLH